MSLPERLAVSPSITNSATQVTLGRTLTKVSYVWISMCTWIFQAVLSTCQCRRHGHLVWMFLDEMALAATAHNLRPRGAPGASDVGDARYQTRTTTVS